MCNVRIMHEILKRGSMSTNEHIPSSLVNVYPFGHGPTSNLQRVSRTLRRATSAVKMREAWYGCNKNV